MATTPSTSNTVERAADIIRARLGELELERKQLEGALESLTPNTRGSRSRRRQSPARRKAPARPRRSSAGKSQSQTAGRGQRQAPRRRKTRARPGQRQAELLKQIRAKPGAPVSQLAKSMGVSPTQLYPIARRLQAQGEVKKHERGFAPK